MNIVIPYRKLQSDKEIQLSVPIWLKWKNDLKIYVVGDEVPSSIKDKVINIVRPFNHSDNDASENILEYIDKVGEPFIQSNDDIFITDYSVEIKNNFYYGTLKDKLEFVKARGQENQWYYKQFKKLPSEWKMYELHIPFIVKNPQLYKKCILDSFKLGTPSMKYTIYGNRLNDETDKDYFETYGIIDSKYHKSKYDIYDRDKLLRPYHSLQARDKLTTLDVIKKEML